MSTRVTLTISDRLYRQAQQIADAQQREVANVLADAIILDDSQNDLSNVESAAIDREEAAFRRLHAQLWSEFPGEYVAIHGGELVDHDRDQVALALRISKRFPNEFVWVAPVGPEPVEEYVIRSPRMSPSS